MKKNDAVKSVRFGMRSLLLLLAMALPGLAQSQISLYGKTDTRDYKNPGNADASDATYTLAPAGSRSDIAGIYGGNAFAFTASGGTATASDNRVTVRYFENKNASPAQITAGHADSSEKTAFANNNAATVENSSWTNVFGGYASTTDGSYVEANNNTVTLRNLTKGLTVYGGAVRGNPDSNAFTTGSANGNTVTIIDGNVQYIIGGNLANGHGTATHNTITLEGNITIVSKLIGGEHLHEDYWLIHGSTPGGAAAPGTYCLDCFTGNTLNLNGVKNLNIGAETIEGGLSTGYLANFATMQFYLSPHIANNETILNINGFANIDQTTINLDIWGGQDLTRLRNGDVIKLIYAGKKMEGTVKLGKLTAQGATLRYHFAVYQEGNTLWARLESASPRGMELRSSILVYHQPLSGIAAQASVLAGYNCDVFQILLDVESGYTDLALLESTVASNAKHTYSDRIDASASMFSYTLYGAEPVKTFTLGQFLGGAATDNIGTATLFGYCFSTRADARGLFYDGAGTCHLSGGSTLSCSGAPTTPLW